MAIPPMHFCSALTYILSHHRGHVDAPIDLQSAFEYFRKESALVGDELRRLLVPKMDGPRSEEEPLQRQQELKALLKRQDEAACLLLTLKGRETPRPLAEEI